MSAPRRDQRAAPSALSDGSGVRADLARREGADFDEHARTLLADERHRNDPLLLLMAVSRGGSRLRRYLHRVVFADLLGIRPVHDALHAALTISAPDALARYLEDLAPAVEAADEARLSALVETVRWWHVPAGHTLQRWQIGAGKTSRVALLTRDRDGARFAWKIPLDDAPEGAEMLRVMVRRSEEWRRLGLVDQTSTMADDDRTLLQPFVEGSTLDDLLRHGPLAPDARAGLVDLLVSIVQARRFVSGVNPQNLIHDGQRWQLIDSGSIYTLPTVLEAWTRQQRDTRRQWTRADVREEVFAPILDEAETRLDLPRFRALRWSLTRLRRYTLRDRPENF